MKPIKFDFPETGIDRTLRRLMGSLLATACRKHYETQSEKKNKCWGRTFESCSPWASRPEHVGIHIGGQ